MSQNATYAPRYDESRALVIGVNDYRKCSPLEYALSDAKAFAELLGAKFGFASDKINLLTDAQATKPGIMASFMEYTQHGRVRPDDRIIVFFAGHGHTRAGRRGEVGFLVPADGDPDDLETLIRWDNLTRNADLIPAKHILFVMDAGARSAICAT
jgi:uncharacterized caspase-like protein